MTRRARAATLVILFLAGSCAVAAARGAPDRLERFRELARTRLGLAELVDPENPAEAYRDIYALLDEEIVESLASGGVFASVEFLQDRLDAFGEAWVGRISASCESGASRRRVPADRGAASPAIASASTAVCGTKRRC